MMSSDYRCKKCRCKLFTEESLVTCHNESSIEARTSKDNDRCCDQTLNVLFVDEQKLDQWIKEQIDSGKWVKGRLVCPSANCGARIGSFNFINGEFCHCGQYQLPSIQFNRSKVDKPPKH